MGRDIRTVGVVGLGTMGAGIAQVAVQAGYDVMLAQDGAAGRTFFELDRLMGQSGRVDVPLGRRASIPSPRPGAKTP